LKDFIELTNVSNLQHCSLLKMLRHIYLK